jgi:putative ABC transport system ATP-binding protein
MATVAVRAAIVEHKAAARTQDAVKVYGKGQTEVRALDRVTVEFATGRFTAIMGPSGPASPPCCTRRRS